MVKINGVVVDEEKSSITYTYRYRKYMVDEPLNANGEYPYKLKVVSVNLDDVDYFLEECWDLDPVLIKTNNLTELEK